MANQIINRIGTSVIHVDSTDGEITMAELKAADEATTAKAAEAANKVKVAKAAETAKTEKTPKPTRQKE